MHGKKPEWKKIRILERRFDFSAAAFALFLLVLLPIAAFYTALSYGVFAPFITFLIGGGVTFLFSSCWRVEKEGEDGSITREVEREVWVKC